MTRQHLALALVAALTLAPIHATTPVQAKEMAVVTPVANLKWTPAGVPGVSFAAVEGDMAKGPSHFYLKYDAGLVTPIHHHSPDHYVTTVSGTMTLTVDGKEHRLVPGSYFALTGKSEARRPGRGQRTLRDVRRRARPLGRRAGRGCAQREVLAG